MNTTKQSEIEKLKNELATLEGRPAPTPESEPGPEAWEQRVKRIFDEALKQEPIAVHTEPVAAVATEPVRQEPPTRERALADRIADARRYYDRQLEAMSIDNRT